MWNTIVLGTLDECVHKAIISNSLRQAEETGLHPAPSGSDKSIRPLFIFTRAKPQTGSLA
jgi:hypothetical protein